MIAGSIARRYSKALLAIGLENRSQEAMVRELTSLGQALEVSAELREAVLNPIFPLTERRAALTAIVTRLGITQMVRNFIMLLLDRGRIGALPDIVREFGAMVDAHAGRVRAQVTAPVEVPAELQTRLRLTLEKRHGKKVVLETRVDPSLIGGMVLEVGDIVYDGSLRHQLQDLKASLLSEA